MKLRASRNFLDRVLNKDITEGDIVNEAYEKAKVELTEEREKVLISSGYVDIVEDEEIEVNQDDILNDGETKLDDTISVEAKVNVTESATATQEDAEKEDKEEVEVNPLGNPVGTRAIENTAESAESAEVNTQAAEVNTGANEVNTQDAEVKENASNETEGANVQDKNKKNTKKTSGNKEKVEENSTNKEE